MSFASRDNVATAGLSVVATITGVELPQAAAIKSMLPTAAPVSHNALQHCDLDIARAENHIGILATWQGHRHELYSQLT